MHRDPNKSLVAARLHPLWLKLTGRDKWASIDALVFSSEYVPYQRTALAHYHVIHSYKVGEERYVGEFDDFSVRPRFKREETISVRFNPRAPKRSYYPEQWTDTMFFIAAFTLGALIGFVIVVANLIHR